MTQNQASTISAEPLWAHSSDEAFYYVDCRGITDAGVELTVSSITTVADTAGVLNISSSSVISSVLETKRGKIPANKSIKFKVTGGVSGTTYNIEITLALSDGSSRTRVVPLKISDT